jgi:hypothetical protein
MLIVIRFEEGQYHTHKVLVYKPHILSLIGFTWDLVSWFFSRQTEDGVEGLLTIDLPQDSSFKRCRPVLSQIGNNSLETLFPFFLERWYICLTLK